MLKVQNSLLLLFVACLFVFASAEDEEDKKAMEEFKKYCAEHPDEVKAWKNLQRRACNASVKVENIPKNLKECYEDQVKAYTGPNAKEMQEISLAVNDKCTKEHPYKDLCNREERNQRFVCYKSGFMVHKKKLYGWYKNEADRPIMKKLFENIYDCFDKKLKEKGA